MLRWCVMWKVLSRGECCPTWYQAFVRWWQDLYMAWVEARRAEESRSFLALWLAHPARDQRYIAAYSTFCDLYDPM